MKMLGLNFQIVYKLFKLKESEWKCFAKNWELFIQNLFFFRVLTITPHIICHGVHQMALNSNKMNKFIFQTIGR